MAGRGKVRVVVLSVCALVVAGIFAAVVRQSWITNSAAAEVVSLEADGVVMLHPMTTLLSQMVETQSAAVRGERVDSDTLRKVLASVATVDAELANSLRTRQRLSDLMAQTESALSRGDTGAAAYVTYSALVKLTVDLMRQIGDLSHLIHDPDLDSYYLMEAAIIRLPDTVVLAGRASDLVTLSGGKPLQGEDATRAAVARFGVSDAAEAVNSGLTKSVDVTARAELGSNIADRLGSFKAASDAFAPPTMLLELSGAVDAGALSANARRVYAAAGPLSHLLLSELEALLDGRAAKLAAQQRFTIGASAAFGLIALGMVLLVVLGRRRTARGDGPSEPRTDGLRLGSPTSARELLQAGELAHAGRSAIPRTRRDGDAR